MVYGKDSGNDLDLVMESFGEKRSDGAVDQSRDENFPVALLSFPFVKTAWNLSSSICHFDVIDGKG